MGGEANQWAPAIYDGMNKIETPTNPGYHLMTDMTNQAISWQLLILCSLSCQVNIGATAR